MLARFGGLDIASSAAGDIGAGRRTTAIWGAILPTDRESTIRQQVQLVEHGLAARRSALAQLGVEDPEGELALIEGEQSRVESRKSIGQPGSGTGSAGQ